MYFNLEYIDFDFEYVVSKICVMKLTVIRFGFYWSNKAWIFIWRMYYSNRLIWVSQLIFFHSYIDFMVNANFSIVRKN